MDNLHLYADCEPHMHHTDNWHAAVVILDVTQVVLPVVTWASTSQLC